MATQEKGGRPDQFVLFATVDREGGGRKTIGSPIADFDKHQASTV